jgi:hypothetical protein
LKQDDNPEERAPAPAKRYCTTHRGEVQGDAGNFVLRNRTTRWICHACQRRRAIGSAPVA